MLSLASQKIFLYNESVDMRKSYDGLSGVVEEHFPDKLLTGSLFVFVNKRRNRMKALYWDSDGLALWCKRLEKGCFRKLKNPSGEISRQELLMILEGIVPKCISKRFRL